MDSNIKQKAGKSAIVLLVLVFLIPVIAGAAPRGDWNPGKRFGKKGHHGSPCGIWRNPELVQSLGLTDEQVKALKDADYDSREEHLDMKSKIDTLRLKMDRAFSEQTVNDKVVLQLAEKISNLKGELFVQKIKSRLAVRKLLNPEQLKKLEERKFKGHGKFEGEHGKERHHREMSRHDM